MRALQSYQKNVNQSSIKPIHAPAVPGWKFKA
eukprot:CAMPEP_0115314402 /NCGR_PEP_ID=MMETSP0270-20121206/77015_1 /TAXON_ID=71861 /ORGANISM="Scrippsiella trochoidea, Strain CCMP3099" /LENGTH=31 /DNA_ID= /DNA_START= /DNA_END= /DNA_ORIENTATION=